MTDNGCIGCEGARHSDCLANLAMLCERCRTWTEEFEGSRQDEEDAWDQALEQDTEARRVKSPWADELRQAETFYADPDLFGNDGTCGP